MANIRVLIVDDHVVVRQGLWTFLELQEGIEVVGDAANGLDAIRLTETLRPDVILMDLVMPDMDGVVATERIKAAHPEIQVVVLTSFSDDTRIIQALRAGATGYLLKDVSPADLTRAVLTAYRGEAVLHPLIAKRLVQEIASPHPAPRGFEALTERELDVLRCIARGMTNVEIARHLEIREKTVKTHVGNILSKLGVSDRTQAAILALKNGLVPE